MGVLESLLPIFLLIGLGAALTARGFLNADALRTLNRVAYWIGMPALLFVSVSSVELSGGRPFWITLALIIATAVALAASFVFARWTHLPPGDVGTFMQASFRGNLAFVGLPLAILVFSRPDAPAPLTEIRPLVALTIAPVMILYNILAVVVLVASQHRLGPGSVIRVAKSVLTNPLILAVAAGLVASSLDLRLPGFLTATIESVAALAVPAALFGVGGTSVIARLGDHARPTIAAALIKVVVTPLVAWIAARVLGLDPLDAGLAVMLAATPTAAASFIMTMQLGGHAGLAASTIMLSTLLSLPALAVALTLLR